MSNKFHITISDQDIFPSITSIPTKNFSTHRAARGIVVLQDKIALLQVNRLGFFKLPGGGIESGESALQAFKREILEEVGCQVTQVIKLGRIIEIRQKIRLIQTSYILVSHAEGKIHPPKLEPDEIADGFKLIWVVPKLALKLISQSQTSDYEGIFIKARDVRILAYCMSQSLI